MVGNNKQSAICTPTSIYTHPAIYPLMTKTEKMERINATIRHDQKTWLDKHPSINVSGLIREAIDKRMVAQ